MKIVLLQNDLKRWPPGTRLYRDEAGQHYAVHADVTPGDVFKAMNLPEEVARNIHTVLPCATTVVPCDERGAAETMDAIYKGPPGTSHEDALAALEYEVVERL